MLRAKLPECSRSNLDNWRKEKPKKDLYERLETLSNDTMLLNLDSSSKDESDHLFPRLTVTPDEITRSLLRPEFAKIMLKMNNLYIKFRNNGPKIHRFTLPTSQFYEDCLNDVIKEVSPSLFQNDYEKHEILKLINDYDHHRLIIQKIIDSYYSEFKDNSWNMPKSVAHVVTFVILRVLNKTNYEEVYRLIVNICPPYRLLPLIHHLLTPSCQEKLLETGLHFFDVHYLKTVFTTSTAVGKILVQALLDDLIQLYYKNPIEKSESARPFKSVPFKMEEYLQIDKANYIDRDLKNKSAYELPILTEKKQIEEAVDTFPEQEKTLGPLIDYERLLEMALNDETLYYERDESTKKISSKKKKSFQNYSLSNHKILSGKQTKQIAKKRKKFSKAPKERKGGLLIEKLSRIIFTYQKEPWKLNSDERKLLQRIQNEPLWLIRDSSEAEKDVAKKKEKSKNVTQRKMLQLTGMKNHCCVIPVEDSKEQQQLKLTTQKTLDFLNRKVDYRKNNAYVLREMASLSKEEKDLVDEMKQLETGMIGLLENKRYQLERELEEDTERAMYIKRKKLQALLSLERALLARQMIRLKNEELAQKCHEEKKMLNEQKRILDEEDDARKRKLVEDIHEMKERANEIIIDFKLDKWIECRHFHALLKEMETERKISVEKELERKKEEIDAQKALDYLNKRDKELEKIEGEAIVTDELKRNNPVKEFAKKIAETRRLDELKRKKEEAFRVNARRKCIRQSAEEYIASRRSTLKARKESDDMKKDVYNEIVIKSKELNDMQKELEHFRNLRLGKTKTPLTEKDIRAQLTKPLEQTSAPIIDNCFYVEKTGVIMRNVRRNLNVVIESKELEQVKGVLKKAIKSKLHPKTPELQSDLTADQEKNMKKRPPPITSLDTFFMHINRKLKWPEQDLTKNQLLDKKMFKLSELFLEKNYEKFREIPKIKEIEYYPEVMPALMDPNTNSSIFRLNGNLTIRQPYKPDRVVIKDSILRKMIDLLKVYNKMRRTAVHDYLLTQRSSSMMDLSPTVFNSALIPDEDRYDFDYYMNKRYMLLTNDQLKYYKGFDDEDFDDLRIRRKKRTRKKYAETETSHEKRSFKSNYPRISTLRRTVALSPKSSDDDDVGIEGTSIESSEETLTISEESDDKFIQFKIDDIDSDFGDSETAIVKRYNEFGKTFDFNIITTIPDKKVSDSIDHSSKIIESKKILSIKRLPSSTALEYLHMMKITDEKESADKNDQYIESNVINLPEAESSIFENKIDLKESNLIELQKLEKYLEKNKLRLTQKQLSNIMNKILELKSILSISDPKPIKYLQSDPQEFFYQFIKKKDKKIMKTDEIYKPKRYPPYKLTDRISKLEKIGIHPDFRIRGIRVIIPGGCRYIQPRKLFERIKKKRKLKKIKFVLSKDLKTDICMNRKFHEIDRMLLKRFPPPYAPDNLLIDHFPSLKEDLKVNKLQQLIESQRQKSSLPYKNENFQKNEIVENNEIDTPTLPTPLRSSTISLNEIKQIKLPKISQNKIKKSKLLKKKPINKKIKTKLSTTITLESDKMKFTDFLNNSDKLINNTNINKNSELDFEYFSLPPLNGVNKITSKVKSVMEIKTDDITLPEIKLPVLNPVNKSELINLNKIKLPPINKRQEIKEKLRENL